MRLPELEKAMYELRNEWAVQGVNLELAGTERTGPVELGVQTGTWEPVENLWRLAVHLPARFGVRPGELCPVVLVGWRRVGWSKETPTGGHEGVALVWFSRPQKPTMAPPPAAQEMPDGPFKALSNGYFKDIVGERLAFLDAAVRLGAAQKDPLDAFIEAGLLKKAYGK